jgi:PAS domain S-box-containing protein
MNPVAEKLTGNDQRKAAGQPLERILHLKDINSGNTRHCTNIFQGKKEGALREKGILSSENSNMEYIVEFSSDPIRNNNGDITGSVIIFRDITDEEFIEKEMKKIQQLESLGLLAGGIAHDFNNILTSVLGNVNLAGLSTISNYDKEQCLQDAESGLLQARELTKQLLTFSKGGMPIKKTTSIKNIIEESVKFILRGSNIICRQQYDDNLWNGIADKSQISQVIQNLIINAKQAMPDGGKIDITVENLSVEKNNDLLITEGNYILIRLSDNGSGIDKNILPDIFNPYFTTKERGHGLGLSVVYSIITKHNGYIFVESEIGEGTLFSIYLPATIKDIKPETIVTTSAFTGGKKILFMDDDEEIRKLAVKMIELLNCEAVTVPDSESAVSIFTQEFDKGAPFDIVILDVTIPGGPGGEETIKELIHIDPGITAIVSSGYSNNHVMSDYKEYGFSAVISKPYKFEELVNTISSLFSN